MASPAPKSWGPNNFSLLYEQSNVSIYMPGTPYIYINTFHRICANLKRDLNVSGGPNPPIPSWQCHCLLLSNLIYLFILFINFVEEQVITIIEN